MADNHLTDVAASDRPGDAAPRRNIELKARVRSLDEARRTAEGLATEYVGVQVQVDTYFHSRAGRLKLREIDETQAQLVWYTRPDGAQSRRSEYHLVPVNDPAGLKNALSAAFGVRSVVRKRREVFLYDNVRIHLDDVAALGHFIEFEAVLSEGMDDRSGHAVVAFLRQRFGIDTSDLLTTSYGDMIEQRSGANC